MAPRTLLPESNIATIATHWAKVSSVYSRSAIARTNTQQAIAVSPMLNGMNQRASALSGIRESGASTSSAIGG